MSPIPLANTTNQITVCEPSGPPIRRYTGRPPFADAACPRSQDREALYTKYHPLVKRLIWQYGWDAEMRKDLVGEIYCRFCALLEAYDPTRGVPLRPYMVRQLTASVYSYVRSLCMVRKRELLEEEGNGANMKDHGYDPTAAWITQLSQQQTLQSLSGAIAALPQRQRQVICLRYYDQLSFDEIASLLKIENSTARSVLRHGLNNLRGHMQIKGCDFSPME
jgi:RNA polymerase sigma factor (sigma-70 family)